MNCDDTKDKESKEALTILIQLVNIAQKEPMIYMNRF